jgi:asparagine synthase (glutamine-hydrolysing)
MCGIAGIVTADGSTPDAALLREMTSAIAHRGPDGDVVEVGPGYGFGHRRLAIIDLETGAQPMTDADRRWTVCFNGEIYNFQELRRELESRGRRFRTRSDTEVMLQWLGEEGAAAIPRLGGMFAVGAWDAHERQLLLFRDRVGKKPLYWFQDARGLYFASEVKALLRLPNCPREVDPDALDLYLAYEAIPGSRTIFKGVHRLPPASVMRWSAAAGVRIDTYWEADWSRRTTLSYEDARRELRRLIVEATRARLIADVPLGAFLSGGVDSSVVVSAMAECASGAVKTFSIGFPDEEADETRFARMVAERFGTTHEEFVVEPNAVDMLPTLAWHYDQPFADPSALPTYYVSRATRQHVTVALNGDGGDEWFGGYERYRALLAAERYQSAVPAPVRGLAAGVAGLLPGRDRSGTFGAKAHLFADGARHSLDVFNLRLFHHRQFERAARATLYSGGFSEQVAGADAEGCLLDVMAESARRTRGDIVDRAMRTDTVMYLPDTLLVKVDIAAMAVGLEARSPLLDASVIEFAASLPREWKVTRTQSKKILKDAHEGILPHEVMHRPKMGFSMPLARWFRSDLQGYVRDVLLDPRTLGRGYFKASAVESLIVEHAEGRRNHASRLWSLLMLEHWHREIADGHRR